MMHPMKGQRLETFFLGCERTISLITSDNTTSAVFFFTAIIDANGHHVQSGLLRFEEEQKAPAFEDRLDFTDRLAPKIENSTGDFDAGLARYGDADAVIIAFEKLHAHGLAHVFGQITSPDIGTENITGLFLILRQGAGGGFGISGGTGLGKRRDSEERAGAKETANPGTTGQYGGIHGW